MALGIITRDITDEFGNILEGAQVTIREGHDEGGPLAKVFSSVSGGAPLANPVDVPTGTLSVYAQPGRYRLEGTSSAGSGVALVDTTPISGKQYATRAAFEADVADGYAPADGTVVTAGGLQYVAEEGATALPGLGGWLPFGVFRPEHFGAVGDDSTDDFSALLALANRVNEVGGHVILSKPYAVSQGVPIYKGTWEFTNDGLIHNIANDSINFWMNTAAFVGTYFGYQSAVGMNAEPEYDIEPVPVGAFGFTFSTALDASDFSVGERVYIKDANKYEGAGPDFRKACHISVITGISEGVVTIRDPFPLPITADGVTKPTVIRETGNLPGESSVGMPAEVRMADGVRIINGAFTSDRIVWSQCVHVSAWECHLDFRYLRGQILLGMNPVAYSHIDLRSGEFRQRAYELAYFHVDVSSDYIHAHRVEGGTSETPAIAVSEYGHTVNIGTIQCVTGASASPAVEILTPINKIGKIIFNGTGDRGVVVGSGGERGEATHIGSIWGRNIGVVGLRIACDNVDVGHVDLDDIDASGRAIVISSDAGSNITLGTLRLGSGPGSGAQYRILDERASVPYPTYGEVFGHYTLDTVRNRGFESIPGTGADNDLRTYTAIGGAINPKSGWRIRFLGNVTTASTNGAKTIKLEVRVGGTVLGSAVGEISLTAGQTGFLTIDSHVLFGTSLTELIFQTEEKSAGGNTFNIGTRNASGASASDLTFVLVANMNAADTLNVREWSVEPYGYEASAT